MKLYRILLSIAFLGISPQAIAETGQGEPTEDEDAGNGESPPEDEVLLDDAFLEEMSSFETVVRAERPHWEATRRVLESDAISRLPGTFGDPLGAVKNFPGVARTGMLGGGLIIRGSEPADTVYLLDGAVIPMIYHFGDLTSIVNASLLDEVQFYPGNFSVRYGRTTAGVLDLKTRPPKETGYRAAVEVDLFDAEALAEGALTPRWSMAVTGRRSYIDGILEATGLLEDELQFSVAPRYYDFQVIADYHPPGKGSVRIALLGADDKLVSGATSSSAAPRGSTPPSIGSRRAAPTS